MDPRHPNIAFAAHIAALVAFISLIFSFFLPFGTPKGWSIPETVIVFLIPIFLSISWWAKLERQTLVVHAHGTSSAQYEAMEDLPTMVSSMNPIGNVNANTAAVIESIIGRQNLHDVKTLNNAIGTLSSGEIGRTSAEIATQNTVQHAVVNRQIPDSGGLQTSRISSVQLPDTKQVEIPESPEMFHLPKMVNLDGDREMSEGLRLPDLPDF